MEIIVRRNEQDYGPYPVPVAQQYLASGRLKPGDFARLKNESPNAHRSLASLLALLAAAPAAGLRLSPESRRAGPVLRRKLLISGLLLALAVFLAVTLFLLRSRPPEPVVNIAPETGPLPLPAPGSAPISPIAPDEVQILREANAYAIGLGLQREATVPELIRLMRNPGGHSQASEPLWKARCVFRWIAENIAYDAASYRAGRRRDYDPDAVLRTRTAVCEGYSALFTSLCQSLGVEAVSVGGYLHVRNEDIGRPLSAVRADHAWNAVKIGDRWLLVDATLAAGVLGERGSFIKQFEPAWFDCPPEQMIWSHFPEEDRRQQLTPPRLRTEFEQFPLATPRFFAVVPDAGALGAGIRPFAKPFLQFHLRREIEIMAKVSAAGRAEVEALFARRPDATGATDLVAVTLPPEAASGACVELFFHAPGDARSMYKQAAVFRVGNNPAPVRTAKATSVPPSRSVQAAPHGESPVFTGDYERYHAHLGAPLVKRLPVGLSQHFRITAPGARNVRLMQDGQTECFLYRTGENVFEGDVVIAAGVCELFGAFSENPGELRELVGFEAR